MNQPRPIRPKPPRPDGLVLMSQLANLIGITTERIRQLQRDGDMPRCPERGMIHLVQGVQAYIAFLKKGAAAENNRSSAESRVRDARAREIEIRTAEREKHLISTTEAIGVMDEVLGGFLSELAGLPARVSRDREVRLKIETEINGIRQRATTRLAEKSSALRTSGEAVEADASDDA